MTNEVSLESYERLIHVHQGECRISENQSVVLTTMLGSCVAACLYDPEARVGGMNHFLLPEADGTDRSVTLRYGAYAMELLVNGLLSVGAKRERLRAKLFGGSQIAHGRTNIGEKNAEFAERYLKREGIPIVSRSVLGRYGRRIQFWPASGRARQLTLGVSPELVSKVQSGSLPSDYGSVELF